MSVPNGDFMRLCRDILVSEYENVLEADLDNGTCRVLSPGGCVRALAPVPVRFFLSDALGFLSSRFIFGNEILKAFSQKAERPDEVLRAAFYRREDSAPCRGIVAGAGALRFFAFTENAGNATDSRENTGSAEQKQVEILSGEHFDVLVGGVPVVFRSKKAKELLALLYERGGGFVSSREASETLWADEEVTPLVLSRCRKAAMHLSCTLRENGIEYLVESSGGKRRFAAEKISRDTQAEQKAPSGDAGVSEGGAWQ